MLGANADGALLQRALDGQTVDGPDIAALVGIAREVESLDQRGLAPRADFVADLRQRLLEMPAGAADSPGNGGPAVMRVGRRARLLVAAAAVLLVLAGGLGALSRSALPGDRLYPVKQLLDRVVLELHREPVGLGRAHLDQAREHVEEAVQLISGPGGATQPGAEPGALPSAQPGADLAVELTPDAAADLAIAFDAATASTTAGDTVLLEVYRSEQRVDALISLSDFHAEVVPAVDALSPAALPPIARAAWQRLHDVLERSRDATLRQLAACSSCGEASAAARALLAREVPTPRSTGVTAGATTTSGPTGAGSLSPEPSARAGDRPTGRDTARSSDSPPAQGSSPRPTQGDGARTSSPAGGAVRLPTVGVTNTTLGAGGGGVTLPGPLPTVTLPDVGVTTSSVTVGGGGVTLPGATVSLPTATLPLPQPGP